MGKNDCNIIRDLMPLVIDRAASEESRRAVEEHIASCAECRKQYEAMKAELSEGARAEYEAEQSKFVAALRSVKRQRRRRRLTAALAAFVICAAAALGGTFAYFRLFTDYSVEVKDSLYSFSLAKMEDGRIAVTADGSRVDRNIVSSIRDTTENGRRVFYLTLYTTVIRNGSQNTPEDKWCFMTAPADTYEIRKGTADHYTTVWREGDDIPAASDEMEEYLAMAEEMHSLLWDENGSSGYERLEDAQRKVPEWQ